MSSGAVNPISTISGQSSASQYGFTDPFSASANMNSTLYGSNGSGGLLSGGPLGTYEQYANPVMSQIAGLSGPLQQTLSGIANYQANNALNSTASNFANIGGLGSGAGAQAFGQAIAQPFAQAQAQLQNSQLSAASGALSSLMGVSGQAYNTGLGQAGNLMEHTSGLVAPTYYTNPAYTAVQDEQAQQKASAQGKGNAMLQTAMGNPSGTAQSLAGKSGTANGASGGTQTQSYTPGFYSPTIMG